MSAFQVLILHTKLKSLLYHLFDHCLNGSQQVLGCHYLKTLFLVLSGPIAMSFPAPLVTPHSLMVARPIPTPGSVLSTPTSPSMDSWTISPSLVVSSTSSKISSNITLVMFSPTYLTLVVANSPSTLPLLLLPSTTLSSISPVWLFTWTKLRWSRSWPARSLALKCVQPGWTVYH